MLSFDSCKVQNRYLPNLFKSYDFYKVIECHKYANPRANLLSFLELRSTRKIRKKCTRLKVKWIHFYLISFMDYQWKCCSRLKMKFLFDNLLKKNQIWSIKLETKKHKIYQKMYSYTPTIGGFNFVLFGWLAHDFKILIPKYQVLAQIMRLKEIVVCRTTWVFIS